MKMRKLVSFLCSLAMMTTTFVGVVSVNAEDETSEGVTLVYNKEKSTSTKADIDVYVSGFETLSAYSVGLVAEGATIKEISYTVNVTGFTATDNTTANDEGKVMFGGYIAGDDEIAVSSDSPIANVVVTFAEALTEDAVVTLTDDTVLSSTAVDKEISIFDNTMPNVSLTVLADPQATPTPTPTATATPTPTPEVTATPIVTIRPTAIATAVPVEETTPTPTPVPITNGIDLVYNKANSTASTANIDVYAKGFETLSAYSVGLVAEGATIKEISYTVNVTGFTATDNTTANDEGKVMFGGYIAGDDEIAVSSGSPIANVVVTFTEALTEDAVITLTDDTVLSSTAVDKEISIFDNTMSNVRLTVLADPEAEEAEATAAPTPTAFPADTAVALKTALGEDYPATYTDGDDTYELVAVSVNTGSAAYGTDYVATYKDKALTAEEYHNAINGYTDTIADVIDGLVFNTKYDVTFKAAPMYQTADNKAKSEAGQEAEAVILMGYEGSATAVKPATPTPTPTATPDPSATPTAKPSSGGGSSRSGGSSTSTIASGSVTGGSSGVAVGTIGFTDLDTVPWAQTAINVLAAQGIINGRSDTIFDPLATVTRAEFTKLVCAAFGVPEAAPATATFTDVSGSDWYFGYVEAAAARGIVNGVSDTEFDPNALITREQMAAMMYRAITVTGATIKSGAALAFSDAASISDYAVESVNTLSAAGVINGMDDGTFAPKANASRAQAACIIYQYFMALVS